MRANRFFRIYNTLHPSIHIPLFPSHSDLAFYPSNRFSRLTHICVQITTLQIFACKASQIRAICLRTFAHCAVKLPYPNSSSFFAPPLSFFRHPQPFDRSALHPSSPFFITPLFQSLSIPILSPSCHHPLLALSHLHFGIALLALFTVADDSLVTFTNPKTISLKKPLSQISSQSFHISAHIHLLSPPFLPRFWYRVCRDSRKQ